MNKIFFTIFCLLFLLISPVWAGSLASKLSGRILLNVEKNGEAWYVNPTDSRRYYLGRPADAFRIMRELALGITNFNLAKIESSARDQKLFPRVAGINNLDDAEEIVTDYDINLSRRLAGHILLQTEDNGEAWYVNPIDLKKYYLGRPADAFRIMRELSLGINRADLALVHKTGLEESLNSYSRYEHKTVTVGESQFKADIVTIDLANPNLKIITDTANSEDCKSNCPTKSLAEYVLASDGFAAINGSYFCSSAGCPFNYYFAPVYNTRAGKMINADQFKYWTTGPLMAFDTRNNFYYFKDGREFSSVDNFEKEHRVKLQAAISNKPRLIEEGMNLLIEWDLDDKQKNTKAIRNAIAYADGKIYLVVVYSATLPDLADVLKGMGAEYALNLDGGYSAALYYNDEYMVGPGREIPNAIIFAE